MFKADNQIWLYLIGIVIFFGILLIGSRNLIFPENNNSIISTLFNQFNNPPKFQINTELDYIATIETSIGTFSIDLFEKSAPNNVNNFIYLSENNYYTKTVFHRLIPNFLLQGGDRNTLNEDLDDDGFGKTGYLINDEISWNALNLSSEKRTLLTELGYSNTMGLNTPKFEKYIVGMASAEPNTNSSQFFVLINSDSDSRIDELNGRYTPIGRVISGFDTFDKISNLQVENIDSQSPRPSEDIILNNITVSTR